MEKINLKKLFNLEKYKINKNVLIVGSGRWSKEIVKEIILNFPNIKKIFIVTNHKKQFESWIPKNIKNIHFLSKIKNSNEIDCRFAIIANKNKDHLIYCRNLLKKKFNVLVEKPLLLNQNQFKELINLSKQNKRNIFLGLQYTFAEYFTYLIKKINPSKILKINFFWYDKKKEIKNSLIKKHDLKIDFNLDIFFHVYSILAKLKLEKHIKYIEKNLYTQKFEKLKFGSKDIEINLKSSRQSKFRKRYLELFKKNGSKLKINFSNDLNLKVIIDNKLIQVPSKFIDTTLKYQLFIFLSNRQTGIKNNKLKKLKKLFQYLELIKKR